MSRRFADFSTDDIEVDDPASGAKFSDVASDAVSRIRSWDGRPEHFAVTAILAAGYEPDAGIMPRWRHIVVGTFSPMREWVDRDTTVDDVPLFRSTALKGRRRVTGEDDWALCLFNGFDGVVDIGFIADVMGLQEAAQMTLSIFNSKGIECRSLVIYRC